MRVKNWIALGTASAFTGADLRNGLDYINRADGARFSSSYFKPSIRQALLNIQSQRKSTISCNQPGKRSQFDQLCSSNKKPEECAKAKLCCWHGGVCKGSNDSQGDFGATLGESAEFKETMKSTEKPQSSYDHEILQQQMRHAVGGSKSALAQESDGNPEARSAFIGFLNDPSSLANMFNAPAGLNYATTGLLSKYTQCPLNVPFCHREKCLNAAGQEPTTAFECYSLAGCCFDSNLYLYRLSFGQSFMSSTAVCHRAIKTPMFHFFSGQLANMNSGIFMPSLMEAVSNKIIDFANTQSGHTLMMEFHQCPLGNGIGSATMKFHYQMAQIWPMYSILRAKGSKITDDLIEALSPYCGWPGISRAQCMLKGCCWSLTKEQCTGPLDLTGHSQESVQSAALALLLRTGDEQAKAEAARTGLISMNSITNGVAYTPSKPVTPLGMAGMGFSYNNGNPVTSGFTLPADTAKNTETGSLEKLFGRRRRRSTDQSGNMFSNMSSFCDNPMISIMMPQCAKMKEMQAKLEQVKQLKAMLNGDASANTSPNNGARFLNLFSNSNVGNAFGGILSDTLDQNGLLMGQLADSLNSGSSSTLSKILLMQTMMGQNSGLGSSYYTQNQFSQKSPTPVFTPQFGSNKPSGSSSSSSGSDYQATSITSMYDSITQNGKTDVENCPAHTQADHSLMSSCMAPYEEGSNPSFERLGQDRMGCKAKGCCWDNDINKGVLLSQTVANRLCLWKIPIDGKRWGLPDLQTAMAGCCRQHPCRKMNDPNFSQGFNSIPTQPQQAQQPLSQQQPARQQPQQQPYVQPQTYQSPVVQPVAQQVVQPVAQPVMQPYQPRVVYQPVQPTAGPYQPPTPRPVQSGQVFVQPQPVQPLPVQPQPVVTASQPQLGQPVSTGPTSWSGGVVNNQFSQPAQPVQTSFSPAPAYQVPSSLVSGNSGSRSATLIESPDLGQF